MGLIIVGVALVGLAFGLAAGSQIGVAASDALGAPRWLRVILIATIALGGGVAGAYFVGSAFAARVLPG